MTPKVLILRTAGTNCDAELAHAFTLAGAEPHTVHLNALIEDPRKLEDFQIIGFPGGFSYGDDIAAGRILANRLKHHLYEPMLAAIDRGVPMIGICNGFQVLVKLGLLPDPHAPGRKQTATLADNASGRFQDRWVGVEVPQDAKCVWTQIDGRTPPDHELPIAHAEGRFVASEDVLNTLDANGQVALRYAASAGDVNGSQRRIAGICDPTGLVFGLMPHPERYIAHTQHPAWTSQPQAADSIPPGLRYFQCALAHVAGKQTAAV